MKSYRVLNRQVFQEGSYKIVPIRYEDRLEIMNWRNEQLFHLRQPKPLTLEDQNNYFSTVIPKLFEQNTPDQLLFSYLEDDICIGYGGLVHINWVHNNAEISFVMNTSLEKSEFHKHWTIFLALIEQLAFIELNIHKVFTYAYDLRPHLYATLEKNGFVKEAVLKEQSFIDGQYMDVVIHEKRNRLRYRLATEDDINLYFEWVNNIDVRFNSFQTAKINFQSHSKWFRDNISSDNVIMLVFEYEGDPCGQVRFNTESDRAYIDISISAEFRGRSLAKKMLTLAISKFFSLTNISIIEAKIKKKNQKSIKSFLSAGFCQIKEVQIGNDESYILRYER